MSEHEPTSNPMDDPEYRSLINARKSKSRRLKKVRDKAVAAILKMRNEGEGPK
jgi:hypothetical protein